MVMPTQQPRLAGTLEFELDRVRVLYEHLPQAWLAQLLYCGTLFGYYWGRSNASKTFLLGWAAVVVVLLIGRAILIWMYRRKAQVIRGPERVLLLRWERYSAVFCLAAGVLQASFLAGIFLLDPSQQFVYFASIFITLMGSVTLYSSSSLNYWCFCAPVLIAGQTGLALQADTMGPVIGAVLVFFVVYLVAVFKRTQLRFERAISDRIEADQSLRRETQVMDSLQIGIVQLRDGVIIRANQLFADQMRTKKDLLEGMIFSTLFAHEADQVAYENTVASLTPKTASGNLTLWFRAPTGGMVAYTVRMTRQASLRTVELVLMLQPAEAHHNADHAYEIALDGTGAGMWDWNPQTNQIRFSDRFKQIVGYEDDNAGFSQDWWLTQSLHPDDRARVITTFELHFEQPSIFDELFRLKRKDGTYVSVHGRGASVRDDAGLALRFIAAITPLGGQYGLRGQSDDQTLAQTISQTLPRR